MKAIVEIENQKIERFIAIYEKYKDYDVINKNSQSNLSSTYQFAKLNVVEAVTVTNDEFKFTVSNLKVSALDLSLFVEGTSYQLVIGVIEVGGNSSHILPVGYSNEKVDFAGNSFEITANTSFEVPVLETGEYVLVYYIATESEGIRVSDPYSLSSTAVNDTTRHHLNLVNSLYLDDNAIKINSSESKTINISLNGKFTYEDLYAEIENYAYVYGMTTQEELEAEGVDTWSTVNPSAAITSGKYRLKYIVGNKTDYVVADVTIE